MTADAAAGPKWARRLAVALGSAVLVTVLAEFALHLLFSKELAAVYRVNETWLYEYIPGASKIETLRSEQPDRAIAYEINADGYRGPPLRIDRGARKRVVVFGDSFIASTGTVQEDTFVARLEGDLRAATKFDVETVNAGVVGYGPDQVLLRMAHDVPALKPDLVVVAVMPENDYGDLLRNRLFDLDPAGGLRRRSPVIPQGLRDQFAEAQSSILLKKLWDRVMETRNAPDHGPGGTKPPDLTNEFLGACRGEFAAAMSGSNDVMHVFFDHPDADVRLEPSSPSAQYKRVLMSRVVGGIADEAKRLGVPLLLVVIPAACDVVSDYDVNVANTMRFPEYRPDNLTAPVAAAADALGIAYVDLLPSFRDGRADGFYFRGGNGHWNAAGQAAASREVTAEILRRRLLR